MNTLILKWNPAISCVDMDDMRYAIECDFDSLNTQFNWSVYEAEKARKGDRIFFLRVGRGKTGIMASGWLYSDPYLDEDWRGTDEQKYYADVVFDVMIFPQRNNILDTKVLQKEIPSVDWKGGHSGVLIAEDDADTLEQVWKRFLDENSQQFEPDRDYVISDLVVRAWGIAFNAHKGQVDKAGKDYFEAHIMDVYNNVAPLYNQYEQYFATDIVALLHDVVEDTDWTIERLRKEGFTDEILEALSCVTRQENEDYMHFVERCKYNKIAKAVKIADLTSNMDITRLNEITDVDVERLRKYHRAYKYLISEQ